MIWILVGGIIISMFFMFILLGLYMIWITIVGDIKENENGID